MRPAAILLALLLAGCATEMDRHGRTETKVDAKYLVKTEIDRVADADRRAVVDSLLLIADKLYKRNPKEWRKSGQPNREAALDRLRQRSTQAWPELQGRREGEAAALAFSGAYSGDRVAALMFGLLSMVDAAFEQKEEFYVLDSLNETKLYNCARNMEVAIWKLSSERQPGGELFLLANELDPANRNLSFEREFGRIIGLLDLMAKIIADRNGRTLSSVTQAVVSTIFLPISFLK
ncbi:MAG: hypothetical protein LBV49_12070 [Azonexus sp.]|jgi:hypothetical protein|nr:hypothetical protein [Azonexus sp.]